MGCVRSKHRGLPQNARSARNTDGRAGEQVDERSALVEAEAGPGQDSLQVNPFLLDYAQRLSEEIVARAMQQWAEADSRYSDIPYIECDLP
ncbi:small membrane A-kinase anchor protein-like [Megalops cyprinoides]|uniref:small membrane A-kinase anchor protein-like n=1 Tax=Megalops cyprinoides TaxID=118141 RepID=UPI0018647645|nr:small membrane A-kinase anchor protein-like [Megalops cyprinoides]XP_036395816.1 small membrane A-kinase anchor protein-like [Megalops cyprinoides]